MSREPKSLMSRLWPKVNKTAGCWLWTASLTKAGYGQISSGPRPHTMLYAHRLVYEALVGPIPEGLELDHLCRNPACCNPAHLEPVTHRENVQRGEAGEKSGAQQRAKTHCKHGHPLSGENLYVDPRGHRGCRICRNAATARSNAQKDGAL